MSSRLSYETLDGLADEPLEEDPDERFSSDKKTVGFQQLPDHVLLKIFGSIEAVPDSTWGSEISAAVPYGHVTDDNLTALIDGYQKRCGLPLVCKRWNKCLSQPSFVWAHLHIGFHELWDVQQRFVDRDLFFSWVRPRASNNNNLALNKAPDEWWPLELTGLRSLTELDLSSCGVSGVPVSLGRLAHLSLLDVGGNWAAPGIMLPHDVACCDSMRTLHMNDCSLKKILTSLKKLTALDFTCDLSRHAPRTMLPGDTTNGLDKLTPELWVKVPFHLLPNQANDFEGTDGYKRQFLFLTLAYGVRASSPYFNTYTRSGGSRGHSSSGSLTCCTWPPDALPGRAICGH
ncbi:hypothetical protein WJX79_009577 [Trebouxia sp. C0005]